MSYECINIDKAKTLIESNNAKVIDVRNLDAYNEGHIENAEHVDDKSIEDFMKRADQDHPLIVCCYHGNMSKSAAQYFDSKGFKETYSLDGGYEAWKQNCVE